MGGDAHEDRGRRSPGNDCGTFPYSARSRPDRICKGRGPRRPEMVGSVTAGSLPGYRITTWWTGTAATADDMTRLSLIAQGRPLFFTAPYVPFTCLSCGPLRLRRTELSRMEQRHACNPPDGAATAEVGSTKVRWPAESGSLTTEQHQSATTVCGVSTRSGEHANGELAPEAARPRSGRQPLSAIPFIMPAGGGISRSGRRKRDAGFPSGSAYCWGN